MTGRRAMLLLSAAVAGGTILSAEVAPPGLLAPALVARYTSMVSGDRAFDTVAMLSTIHRLPASSGFNQAADYIAKAARDAGLDVSVLEYPADGHAEYWTWRTFPEWDANAGQLSWVTGGSGTIASFADTPVSLASYSENADITADVVDIGPGYRDGDYAGKDVKGKIVFTNGFPSMVRQKAVIERGAAGIITWYNEATQPDAAAWLSLPIDREATEPRSGTFAFVLSFFQGRPLKQALDRGDQVRVHARVDATTRAGKYKVVSATLHGSRPSGPEIWFTAHLDHQKPGANDNASGSGAILEVAQSLATAVRDGILPRPDATLRFLWGPEMIGNVMFLHDHPDLAGRVLADFNLDTVGENQSRLGSSLWVVRPPGSRAHFTSDVAENLALFTLRNNRRLLGGRPDGPFISARGGSRAVLNAEVVPYVGGSDHLVFNDGAIGIPSVGYIHYPDPTWHTNVDRLDYVDSTTLARTVFMTGAAAIALGWQQVASFDALERNSQMLGDVRLAQARSAAREAMSADKAQGAHAASMIIEQSYREERQVVESLAHAVQFSAAAQASLQRDFARLERLRVADRAELGLGPASECAVATHVALGTRRPRRTGWKGPLDQYRNVLAARLGAAALAGAPAAPHLSSVAMYEALNFADGTVSLQDLYHRVAGECLRDRQPLPDPQVFQSFFDLLEKARLVEWR